MMSDGSFGTDREAERLAEAAAWRIRLKEMDLDTSADFAAWLAADRRNEAAWRQVQSPWELFGEQAASPELVTLRQTALGNVRNAGKANEYSRGHLIRACAAVVIVAAAGTLLLWQLHRPEVYQTVRGERRMLTLEDGSQVTLDSETELRVLYSARTRDLSLVRGQARFSVAHGNRPFAVLAKGQQVIATGTMFNIDLLDATMYVTLLEGQVVVVPEEARSALEVIGLSTPQGHVQLANPGIDVVAGQQLVYGATGRANIRPANIELATAWEGGHLAFENEPLFSVTARINRYSEQTVSIADERVGSLKISGVFTAGDMQGFVATISSYLPVRAIPEADGDVTLSYR